MVDDGHLVAFGCTSGCFWRCGGGGSGTFSPSKAGLSGIFSHRGSISGVDYSGGGSGAGNNSMNNADGFHGAPSWHLIPLRLRTMQEEALSAANLLLLLLRSSTTPFNIPSNCHYGCRKVQELPTWLASQTLPAEAASTILQVTTIRLPPPQQANLGDIKITINRPYHTTPTPLQANTLHLAIKPRNRPLSRTNRTTSLAAAVAAYLPTTSPAPPDPTQTFEFARRPTFPYQRLTQPPPTPTAAATAKFSNSRNARFLGINQL